MSSIRQGRHLVSLRHQGRALLRQRFSTTSDNYPPTSTKAKTKESEVKICSSCPENTVIAGVNYLKGQAPVLAKKDEVYPPWLWDLLKPKVLPDDGPGGKGEKLRLRAASRARIKEQNFMKTQ